MKPAIASMLARYSPDSLDGHINALREIFQELALLGLWRAKFFEHAAFYGGTALRIFYGLDRFSEDLDFSLMEPAAGFDLSPYCKAIERELSAWGFSTSVVPKVKSGRSSIESAFLKANTHEQLISIEVPTGLVRTVPPNQVLKIKLEVDTAPPAGFDTEAKYVLSPIPFSVRTYVPSSLFAGKMHAVLCRRWQRRVKGRDWYDLVWYVSQKIPLNLEHLTTRMRDSGHLEPDERFDEGTFRERLAAHIEAVDLENAKKDVLPFIRDPAAVALWSPEFFHSVADRIVMEGSTGW